MPLPASTPYMKKGHDGDEKKTWKNQENTSLAVPGALAHPL